MNWNAFLFSLAILLGVLIFVNLTASGFKLEGFEGALDLEEGFQEGAGNPKQVCFNVMKSSEQKINDLLKTKLGKNTKKDDVLKGNTFTDKGRKLGIDPQCIKYLVNDYKW